MIKNEMRFSWSGLTIIFILFSFLFINIRIKHWTRADWLSSNEINQYYSYLPAKFIFDDIKLEKSDYQYSQDKFWFTPKIYLSGKLDFGKMYGMAILYSPFFFTAHQAAIWLNFPLNGFSEPYRLFISLSTIFYLFIGLYFVRKILLHFNFSEISIAISILLIALATNILKFSTLSAGNYPIYIFSLSAVFIYMTIMWHSTIKWKYLIAAGLCLILISLIQFQFLVISVLFFLYNVNSLNQLKDKRLPLIPVLAILALSIALWVPQLKYWHIATGSYLGVADIYERMEWNSTEFIHYLLNLNSGWFFYFPVIFVAVTGIFMTGNRYRQMQVGLPVFLIAAICLSFSVGNLQESAALGHPEMVVTYSGLAVSIAAFTEYVFRQKKGFGVVYILIISMITMHNIINTFPDTFFSDRALSELIPV